MGLSSVKPYFDARLTSLNFVEWGESFDFNNIPETIRDKSYHITFGEIFSDAASMQAHEFIFPVTVRVFVEGFRDQNSARNEAISRSESILAEVLASNNRLGVEIKDIIPNSILINPASDSNDHDLILQMSFSARVFYCF